MSTHQVAAALDGEAPAAHYWYPEGLPALAAVTVHGRTGPQADLGGVRLTGRPVSEVDTEVIRYTEDHGLGWMVSGDGGPGPEEYNMYVRATRAGDTVVSGARFSAPDREDRG
ncbi:hypothetical protein [Kitasatospora sp. NE20-6]|uniref:hypothetical protein n=1 Tax=Kitasatospora sp. NE20-6 TaxID=2859066 RepID=UPI0038B2AC93